MTTQLASIRDINFVMHEIFNVSQFVNSYIYSEFNKKTIDLIINEARNFSIKEILPTREIGDQKGVTIDKQGNVTVPDEIKKLYNIYKDNEWFSLSEHPEYGGHGIPQTVALAAREYLLGANMAFAMTIGATEAAGKLLENMGNNFQKSLYLRKLYSGEWSGTMDITEPQAGSDVGAINTSATLQPDGTYSITGNKIFISGGDHNMTENIIHFVLARIEGAPSGSKGLSLFLVPKYWVNYDGSLGEYNDVSCIGIEEKMGIHGSPTCSIAFGSKNICKGLLLGEENNGLSSMFNMMQDMRVFVGLLGFICASSAYHDSLNYAQKRIQGRSILTKDYNNYAAIVEHPDIRRILLTMKVYIEGMRTFLYFDAFYRDKINVEDSNNEKINYKKLLKFLNSIIKLYISDKSFDICNYAVQVHGGYGYVKDYGIEQLFRDCRITSIYEGCNGIHSLEFLKRSITDDAALSYLYHLIQDNIKECKDFEQLKNNAQYVENALNYLYEVTKTIYHNSISDKSFSAYANAYTFIHAWGDIIIAWMLLLRAKVASKNLLNKKTKKERDKYFYQGQIYSLEFFCNFILPHTFTKMDTIYRCSDTVTNIPNMSLID